MSEHKDEKITDEIRRLVNDACAASWRDGLIPRDDPGHELAERQAVEAIEAALTAISRAIASERAKVVAEIQDRLCPTCRVALECEKPPSV